MESKGVLSAEALANVRPFLQHMGVKDKDPFDALSRLEVLVRRIPAVKSVLGPTGSSGRRRYVRGMFYDSPVEVLFRLCFFFLWLICAVSTCCLCLFFFTAVFCLFSLLTVSLLFLCGLSHFVAFSLFSVGVCGGGRAQGRLCSGCCLCLFYCCCFS